MWTNIWSISSRTAYEWARTPEDILWRRTRTGLRMPENGADGRRGPAPHPRGSRTATPGPLVRCTHSPAARAG